MAMPLPQLHFRIFPWVSIQSGKNPVLRYYLKEVLANTENVRIVKEAEAAYGKNPKEIATGVAALTMENREASLTFVNEKARYDRYSHNDCIKNTIPLLFS